MSGPQRVLRGYSQLLGWWHRAGKPLFWILSWVVERPWGSPHDPHCLVVMPLCDPLPWIRLGPVTCFQPIEYGKDGGWDVSPVVVLHYVKFCLASWLTLETVIVLDEVNRHVWGFHMAQNCRKPVEGEGGFWELSVVSSQLLARSQGLQFCSTRNWILPTLSHVWNRFFPLVEPLDENTTWSQLEILSKWSSKACSSPGPTETLRL